MHDHPLRCGWARSSCWCPSTAWSAAFNASMAQRGRPGCVGRFRIDGLRDVDDQVMSRSPRCGDALTVDVDVTPDIDVIELAELPLLLTVRQAAKVLGICPAKAYEMAHRYEATGSRGAAGNPAGQVVPSSSLAVRGAGPHWPCLSPGRARGARPTGGQQLRGRRRRSRLPAVVEPEAVLVLVRLAGAASVVSVRRRVVVGPVRSSSCGCSPGE